MSTHPASTKGTMAWADALSTEADLAEAVDVCAEALGGPADEPFDLLFCFASAAYPDLDDLGALLADALRFRHLVGCSGGGIIGGGREVEFNPALSLVAARLPGVDLHPFHLTQEQLDGIGSSPSAWSDRLGAPREGHPGFVVLADPYSLRAEQLVAGIDFAYPGAPVAGGLASGGDGPGDNRLFLDDAVHHSGAVGVALTGGIRMDTIVAQGVRPAGPSFMVTRAEGQLLYELDEKPIFEALEGFFEGLPEEDLELARQALFLGISRRADNDAPEHGDFLIRNVMGVVRDERALVVGEQLREGQLVRFHVRDATSSAQDLALHLSAYAQRSAGKGASDEGGVPAGALLFSCLGRGVSLYGEAGHDTRAFKSVVGDVPLGGFFCNGEIGPVGGSTYLHGYTSAFALFHPDTRPE